MKKVTFLFFLLLIWFNLMSQEDDTAPIEAPDPTIINNWLTAEYHSFFEQQKRGGEKPLEITILPTTNFNQFDSRWSNNTIGTGFCSNTIRGIGCALTCQAMIVNSRGYDFNPGTWNTYLRNNNGYSECNILFQRDLMREYSLVNPIYANGAYWCISKQYCIGYYGLGETEDKYAASVLKYALDRGAYAIIKVNRGYSKGVLTDRPNGHFIVIKGYLGENPTLRDFIVADPGTSVDDYTNNLTLEHYYSTDCKSPLFVSTTYKATIRLYFRTLFGSVSPPELPTDIPITYDTGNYFSLDFSQDSINIPQWKSSCGYDMAFILKRNNKTIDTHTGFRYSYYLTKPGSYTITMIVGGDHGITESTQSFTVKGEPIILPNDCLGYLHTIPSELNVTPTSISFKYQYSLCNGSCSWNCESPAIKAVGPGITKYKHGCNYVYNNLVPNSHYKFWASYSDGWSCNVLWNCKYNDNRFFEDCCANIITTPFVITQNSLQYQTGQIENVAFEQIILKPGFSYKPLSASDSYSARIVQGKQFWIACNECDSKKSSQTQVDNIEDSCDCKKNNILNNSNNDLKNEIKTKEKVLIFPNPTSGLLKIDYDDDIELSISIFDIHGICLMKSTNKTIDLSQFPIGMYIVEIKSINNLHIEKIIKTN